MAGARKPPPSAADAGNSAAHIAARLIADGHYVEMPGGLVFWWNGEYWEEITESTLLSRAFFEDADPASGTHHRRSEVVKHLRAACHQHKLTWGRVGTWEVACKSGVVDLTCGLDPEAINAQYVETGAPVAPPAPFPLRGHRPEDYLESVIPWGYEPDAQCPIWLDALATFFDEDLSKYDALQEFFGYVVLPHARLKKALLLYGPGDTGKSLVIMVLKMLAGDDFTAALPVTEMNDPRRCHVLVGKRLNVMTELTADAMIADGGFKTLVSTEEPVLIDPKHKAPFMYVPFAKHAIATNNLPEIRDRTSATFNRLMLIPFDRVLTKAEQDPTLLDKIREEMPGVFAWAIAGARRLLERGGEFTQVGAADKLMEDLRAEANPIIGFVNEEMSYEAGSAVPIAQVRDAFNAWYGGSRKWNSRTIANRLRTAGLTTRRYYLDGAQQHCLIDFRFRVSTDDPPVPGPGDYGAPPR